jgi:putative ATPase
LKEKKPFLSIKLKVLNKLYNNNIELLLKFLYNFHMDKELFDFSPTDIPLAEKMRPENLEGFIGQDEIIGKGSLLKRMIESQNLSSFILWGPPGCGKTTIANIIAKSTNTYWKSFSAVVSGIKEVKEIMVEAENDLRNTGKKTVLFIDEIHRFNKAQQDAFLPYVEKGTIILIGATTENPSFSIISPLLSRMRVFILKRLTDQEMESLLNKAIFRLKNEEKKEIKISDENLARIVKIASGDARRCYGIFEMSIKLAKNDGENIIISKEIIEKVIQGRLPSYDKHYDYHYDYISALHKSMRNSDVNAAVYYTVKMIESGEDPLYIIRRVIQFSAEDVGLADPAALGISISARDTIMALGMPEAKLAIIEAVIYNALAPKSNSTLESYHRAKKDIDENPDIPVPLQIRKAETDLMKNAGYGDGYQYAHNFETPVTGMQCLPDELKDRIYYEPKDFGFEKTLKARVEKINEIKKKLRDEKK